MAATEDSAVEADTALASDNHQGALLEQHEPHDGRCRDNDGAADDDKLAN